MKVTIGTASAGPGEKSHGRVSAGRTTLGGFDLFIPVTVINGVKEGPKLLISAAMHGNEIVGSMAIVKLAQRIDPKKLKGTFIGVPVVNPMAFEKVDRGSFWDGQILNWIRTAPRQEGSPSERLWHAYQNEIVSKADYHIDIHSGALPFVDYTSYTVPGPEDDKGVDPEVYKKMRDMGLAFGIEQVLCKIPAWGEVTNLPVKKNSIPHILVEVGGGDWHKSTFYTERTVKGLTNIMKHLGMLEGKIEPQDKVAKVYDASYTASTRIGGFVDRLVDYGDEVKKGQELAVIYDPFTGEERGRLIANTDGFIMNTGVLFPAVESVYMVIGKLVETVDLKKYFKL